MIFRDGLIILKYKGDGFVKSPIKPIIVIPVKTGIRAPVSRCDWRGGSPLSGDARS